MKLGNGMGGISKASGNRRKPYCARVTTGWSFDEATMKKKQVQKVIGYYRTKSEALQALVDYNRDPYNLDATQVTFNDLFKMVTFTESSRRNYMAAYKYLAPVADLPIRSIKPAQLQDCINSCQTSQQPLIKTICKRVYRQAMMHEYVERDISQFITAKSKDTEIERELFTQEEIIELWSLKKYWWAKVTLILLYTGMRTKELKTIDLDMLDLDDRWLDIPFGKNKYSVRGIPLHLLILPLIKDYMINGGNLYGYSHSTLNKALNAFHGHRAHDTRHTFTTKMRECKVDHVIIQRLLGHAPSDITYKVYTHLNKEELKNAIDMLDY